MSFMDNRVICRQSSDKQTTEVKQALPFQTKRYVRLVSISMPYEIGSMKFIFTDKVLRDYLTFIYGIIHFTLEMIM